MVNASLFHDIFQINRQYLPNGELVDLHEDYSNAKCFISDDGLCGFAIEDDGNLISVFSLNGKDKRGFLYSISDFIREQGATHLDAYASKNQDLEAIYEKTLGFRTASRMDYNMEYDHDGIAKNHGKPDVVFMVADDKDTYTAKDLSTMLSSSFKPVTTGFEDVEVTPGTHVRVPVLHKCSEAVLLPPNVLENMQMRSPLLRGLSEAAESEGIDVYLFNSAVKVGGFGQVNAVGVKGSHSDVADYVREAVRTKRGTVHSIPYRYYGKTASIEPHVRGREKSIAMQAIKVVMEDVEDDDAITRADGEAMTGKQAKDLMAELLTAQVVNTYSAMRFMFDDPEAMNELIKRQLTQTSYSSPELAYMMNILGDGETAIPLFNPATCRKAQEVLSAVIRSRLAKVTTPGGMAVQESAAGFDLRETEASLQGDAPESEKLHIVFDGEGPSMHIKYIECYMPLFSDDLAAFADRDGGISAETLDRLVKDGTIPEKAIEFIAYRGPSDGAHSVLPLRVKAFLPNVNGSGILLPREVMALTGNDFDADKLSFHNRTFRLEEYDREAMRHDFDELSEAERVKYILGQTEYSDFGAFSAFERANSDNPRYARRRIRLTDEYDYSKPAIMQRGIGAIGNAIIDTMWAVQTSPTGSQRMFIPGGFERTKKLAKSIQLLRMAETNGAVRKAIARHGSAADALSYLQTLSPSKLDKIIAGLTGSESPYGEGHAMRSFSNMMTGSETLSIYAMYKSALARLRGKGVKMARPFTMFGHRMEALDLTYDREGHYVSDTMGTLLCASADNNKDPLMNILNQNGQTINYVAMLSSGGFTQQDIMLLLCQPAAVEFARLMGGKGRPSAKDAAIQVAYKYLSAGKSLSKEEEAMLIVDAEEQIKQSDPMSEYDVGDLADALTKAPEDSLPVQLSVLKAMANLAGAANEFKALVDATRPDAAKQTIRGTIGDTREKQVRKRATYDEERADGTPRKRNIIIPQAVKDAIKPMDIDEYEDKTVMTERFRSTALPYVAALNNLMMEIPNRFFSRYFPQARRSWLATSDTVARAVYGDNLPSGAMDGIMTDMILWKLLSDRKLTGDLEATRSRLLDELPGRLNDIKGRVADIKRRLADPEKAGNVTKEERELEGELAENGFFDRLTVPLTRKGAPVPLIRLELGSTPTKEVNETLRSDWAALLSSRDKDVKALATDLLAYELIARGFRFGSFRGAFSHLAPFNVIMKTPEYVAAMKRVLRTDWDADETQCFILQYACNHYRDKGVAETIDAEQFGKLHAQRDPGTGWLIVSKPPKLVSRKRFLLVRDGNDIHLLHIMSMNPDNRNTILGELPILGARDKKYDVPVTYTPYTLAYDMSTPASRRPQDPTNYDDDDNDDDDDFYTGESPMDIFKVRKGGQAQAQQSATAAGPAQATQGVPSPMDLFGVRKGEPIPMDLFGVRKGGQAQTRQSAQPQEAANEGREATDEEAASFMSADAFFRAVNGGQSGHGKLFSLSRQPDMAEDDGPAFDSEPDVALDTSPLDVYDGYDGRDDYREADDTDWDAAPARVDEDGEATDGVPHGATDVLPATTENVNANIRKADGMVGEIPEAPVETEDETNGGDGEYNDAPEDAARQMNELAKKLENGEVRIKRLLEGVDKEVKGVLGKAEALLERGDSETDAAELEVGFGGGSATDAYLKRPLVGREQERQLEAWAKESGLWLNDKSADATLESHLGSEYRKAGDDIDGSESMIYIDDANDAVVKAMRLSHVDNNPRMMLDRLATFNALFPNTAYTVLGFGRDSNDRFRVIVSQPVVADTRRVKQAEIDAYMQGRGFTKYGGWWYDGTGTVRVTDMRPANVLKAADGVIQVIDADIELADKRGGVEATDKARNARTLPIATRATNEEGDEVTCIERRPVTPGTVAQARAQRSQSRINAFLEELLRSKGVAVGVLTDAERRLGENGVADFDTARVTAEGLIEMIRLAEGEAGSEALPEEFAHVALRMLGLDHPLVSRLLNALRNDEDALREVLGDQFGQYMAAYGGDMDMVAEEAAGKLVARHFLAAEPTTPKTPFRSLVERVVNAIRKFLRGLGIDRIRHGLAEADWLSSRVAEGILDGSLADEMDLGKVGQSKSLYSLRRNIDRQNDILNKMLKIEMKRFDVYWRRYENKLDKGVEEPSSIKMTREAIAKLEKGIEKNKVASTVTSYLGDTLEFLSATERSLDEAIEVGRSMNSVCGKLNIVRDTIYSYSEVLDDLEQAMTSGEGGIDKDAAIRELMDRTTLEVDRFNRKYHRIALEYFTRFLRQYYGDEIEVKIGPDKGKVIKVSELARYSYKDISLINALFQSLADTNDLVNKAFDSAVKERRFAARAATVAMRRRIDTATRSLVEATGSADQSFMFARHPDGKKNGRYIDAKEAKRTLSAPQLAFYREMMAIKGELDAMLPQMLIEDSLATVKVMKPTMQRAREAGDVRQGLKRVGEAIKSLLLDEGADTETDEVVVDFEGNRVDTLPVQFTRLPQGMTEEDVSDDVASSMLAYADMANDYHEMQKVIGILENAKYMAGEREVQQRSGSRLQRETVAHGDVTFTRPMTKKQLHSNINRALEAFFQMHVYGHIQKAEGNIGNTQVSKRKLASLLNNAASFTQMGLNIPMQIANVTTGNFYMFTEAMGGDYYGGRDIAWAYKTYLRDLPALMSNIGVTDNDSKLALFCELFDVQQANSRTFRDHRPGSGRSLFNMNVIYAGLTAGEHQMSTVSSLALAHSTRLRDASGKEVNLYDALEVAYENPAERTGAYLRIKDGVTKADGSAFTEEDMRSFATTSATVNFRLQGIYNVNDRSAVQQYAFGSLVIMYRKWIAPAIARRYGEASFNSMSGKWQEGYYRTAGRLLLNAAKDMRHFSTAIRLNWDKMDAVEKSNVRQAITETGCWVGSVVALALLDAFGDGDDKDERGWAETFLVYQLYKLKNEIGAVIPGSQMADEALKILNSPFAAMRMIQKTLDLFGLLWIPNWWTEIKSGKYKGHTKAYKTVMEAPYVSIWRNVKKTVDRGEINRLINYYKNGL